MRKKGLHQNFFVLISWQQEAIAKHTEISMKNYGEETWTLPREF